MNFTSHVPCQLCNSNTVWEKIFRREVETPVTPELEALAEKEGWKQLFYTNKLQLQVDLVVVEIVAFHCQNI